jgi:two-component system, sensor histidine kinase and response regulator
MTKILVIEDEAMLLEEIVDILTFEGYTVITADNGTSGIEQALYHLPDLIISDIMMPISDGYDVLEALQESRHTQSIPFIFLTAKASRDDQRSGMNLGADDYLTKPFETDELLNSVEARLERATRFGETSEHKAQMQREKLIRHISHELKNPLTAMQMASSLIQKYIGAKAVPNLDV